MAHNVLGRLSAYIEQMEIQWRLEPELDILSTYWDIAGNKFQDWGQIEKGLETWLERVQNIGLGYNWYDRIVRRIWRQAMASVFLEPLMAIRNSVQAFTFHPDRSQLIKYFVRKRTISPELREKGRLYFDTFVSQLGGLRQDWLHIGQPGFLIPEWWNRFADSINQYGNSDYYPRMLSFNASMMKASEATAQFRKDGDVQKWIKRSGARHLRISERNHVLTHFLGQADTTFDTGIKGLREISGADMATFYVAQRIADITHFKYRRATRGLMEQGKTGTTLWNLVVFTRGYGQRLYFQAEKIKTTFSGETTWNEAREGFEDIFKLVAVSLIFDGVWRLVSGRDRNPYFILDILFGWNFGGLFIGVAQDVTTFVSDIATLFNPLADEERKNMAMHRLPIAVESMSNTLVPFYRRIWDVVESIAQKEHIDRQLVRHITSIFNENYTPEELDKLDMELWERYRKAIVGSPSPDISALERASINIQDVLVTLGTMNVEGRYVTLGDLGRTIRNQTKDIPAMLISAQEGYDPLIEFYKESEVQWRFLEGMTRGEKNDWRKDHILEEAMLLFWEEETISVFRRGTPEGEEVLALVRFWFDRYDITQKMHRAWADWTLPTP